MNKLRVADHFVTDEWGRVVANCDSHKRAVVFSKAPEMYEMLISLSEISMGKIKSDIDILLGEINGGE